MVSYFISIIRLVIRNNNLNYLIMGKTENPLILTEEMNKDIRLYFYMFFTNY